MSTSALSTPAAIPEPSASPLDFVILQILVKQGKETILSKLSARWGLAGEDALAVLREAYGIKRSARRKEGVKTLCIGVSMLSIGLLISILRIMNEPVSLDVLYYLLIFVGAARTVQGLFMIAVG